MMDPIRSAPILKGRLRKPLLPTDLVLRYRLAQQLDQAVHHPFILISAPAGYGKSTLLSSWLDTCRIPFTWLTISDELNDFDLFMHYLLQSLRGCFPNAFHLFELLLSGPQRPPDDHLLAVFCDELYEVGQSFIIVLDDYYLIHEARTQKFIEGVVENAPAGFHLVVATRWDPGLPLMRWRAMGKMSELRADQLSFQPEEVRLFLRQALGTSLSNEAVDSLSNRSEGWIASLRLVVLSLQVADDPENVASTISRNTDRLVSAYLLEQVYSKLSPDIQDFMIKSSILERMCADLCGALKLSTHPRSQEVLEYLMRSNLFLVPLDPDGVWYRYHHLVRDDLLMRLDKQIGNAERARLHKNAGKWFSRAGYIDEAIEQFLAGDDPVGAAVLIESQLKNIMNRDDRRVLERWISQVPETIIEQRPMLLLAKALLLHFQFRLAAIPGLLDRVELLLSQWSVPDTPLPEDSAFGLVHVLRAQHELFSNRPQYAIAHAQAALNRLPADYYFARGLAEMYLGISMQMTGHEDDALEWLEREVESTREGYNTRTIRLLMGLGQININAGYLSQAERAGAYLIRNSDMRDYLLGSAWGRYTIGYASLLAGQYDRAFLHFTPVVEHPYSAHTRAAHECHIGLALVFQARGATQLADNTLASAEALATAAETPVLLTELLSFRARLALLRGDPKLAFNLMQPLFDRTLPDFPYIFLELPYLTLARTWIASGEPAYLRRAIALLDKMLEKAKSTNNLWRKSEILAIMSLAQHRQGDEEAALQDLDASLALAQPHGIRHMFLELQPDVQSMLGELSRHQAANPALKRIRDFFGYLSGLQTKELENYPADLTRRELEILKLLERRMSYADIAEALVISPLTVKTHTSRTYKKLGARGRRDAVAMARQLGLLKD